jgi:hypothetical protein
MATASRILSSFDNEVGKLSVTYDDVTGVVSQVVVVNGHLTKPLTFTARLTSDQSIQFQKETVSIATAVKTFDVSGLGWTIGPHTPISPPLDWEVSWG